MLNMNFVRFEIESSATLTHIMREHHDEDRHMMMRKTKADVGLVEDGMQGVSRCAREVEEIRNARRS